MHEDLIKDWKEYIYLKRKTRERDYAAVAAKVNNIHSSYFITSLYEFAITHIDNLVEKWKEFCSASWRTISPMDDEEIQQLINRDVEHFTNSFHEEITIILKEIESKIPKRNTVQDFCHREKINIENHFLEKKNEIKLFVRNLSLTQKNKMGKSFLADIYKQEQIIHEHFKRIMPNVNYLEALGRNFTAIEKMVAPHQAIIEQMSKLNHVIQSPEINQLQALAASMEKLLPKYSNNFLLSSSIVEAYRHSNIIAPDIFKHFSKTNEALIRTTNLLATEFEKLNIEIINKPLIFDNIPTMLLAPAMSSSAHFQILKNLNYIDVTIDDAPRKEYNDAVNESYSAAEIKIKSYNSDWLILLHGAEQSLMSRNPDKVRHTITSLRELITQILHNCAPDEELREKYTDAKYFHEGKPTRRTRIEFILTKKYSDTSLVKLIDKDVSAIMEMFNLFQEGTHEVISSLNDEELKFILKRAVLLIEQLL